MTEQTKDYSLLRPFDLEAAKAGEPTCYQNGSTGEFVVEGKSYHVFLVEGGELAMNSGANYRMKPLAWVEGKPVYKGDVLYYKPDERMGCASRTITGTKEAGLTFAENDSWAWPTSFTWQPPAPKTKKVKLLGWFNGFELTWTVEIDKMRDEWKRVPSEDKEIEVEV